MSVIRWGILGLGRIAHKFAQDLQSIPDAHLLAVASTDQQRANDFAAQYGVSYAFGSYEEMVTCSDLDVVYIASSHTGHYDHTLLCLNAGVAVLCEKPFAINSRQVREMVETARAKSIFLMEALWSRFMPTIEKSLDLIEKGVIGRVTGVRADFGFRASGGPEHRVFNKALGGGSLLDIGIYPLFLAYSVLGKPQSVKASAVMGPTGVDEECGMILTYADNRLALLHSSLVSDTCIDAVIYGETGSIYLPTRFLAGSSVIWEPYQGNAETFTFQRNTWGYDYEARHVMQCLRDKKIESPVWSLDDSLNLINLLDIVREEAGICYKEDL